MKNRVSMQLLLVAGMLVLSASPLSAYWSPEGVAISDTTGTQNFPCIVSDGAGGAIIAWQDNRDGTVDIYAQRVNASGAVQWRSDGVALCTAAGNQQYVAITSDGVGGAIVAWHDPRSGNIDIYVQRVSAWGTVQWAANGIALCAAAGDQRSPVITSDGGGGAIVAWEDRRSGSNYDVCAQRVDPSGAVQWTANGIVLCAATGDQMYLAITSDVGGGAIVTWADGRNGSNVDIYAQRVNAPGAVQWTANGVALCTATGNQYSPTIASDGAGGAIVTWYDQRSGNYDIYAQRVNAWGTVLWTANGVALCTETGDQYNCKIAPDGVGGVIVTWNDSRGEGEDSDIYAQRISAAGTVQWTANGEALCTATGLQVVPTITSDGGGGAIVTWTDGRGGTADIYAQRVNASGAAQWTAQGVGINTNTGDQQYPKIVGGGAGGAIIVWEDYRNGNWDIFAQSPPECSVSPTAIDFGNLCVGAQRDMIGVVKNTGGAVLSGSISELCEHFSIISGGGPYNLNSNDSVVVVVRFNPLAEGSFECSIDTGIPQCPDVDLTGQGEPGSVIPTTLDFGSVGLGYHTDRTFTIVNTCGGTLAGTVSESCTDFSILSGEGPYSLEYGDSLMVNVLFEPGHKGAAACTISTGGICSDVVCAGSGYCAPYIYLVRDVPGDQGGCINVSWDAYPSDTRQEHGITSYTVWRAIDPEPAELSGLDERFSPDRIPDLAPNGDKPIIRMGSLDGRRMGWKLISKIDAYYLQCYSEVVPTLFDSTAVCQEKHYVQVIAHTSNPYVFWASDPDSGRSVDNLAPCPPCGLAGEQLFTPPGLGLTWRVNAEADLAHYAIYRGTSIDFVPSASNLIASPGDTLHFDSDWRWRSGYYYKVSALDVHGNESGFALLRPEDISGIETPTVPDVTYLAQNFPNPFNPLTKIAFGLDKPAGISLRVYNADGRLVRTLAEGNRPAANYVEVWDGKDAGGRAVASGVYFYRLDAGSFTQTRKMILLR